jgi:hypothetical protein
MRPTAFISCLIVLLALIAPLSAHAQAQTRVPEPDAPTFYHNLSFEQLGNTQDLKLMGINDTGRVEFLVRRDRIATEVVLNLTYTPSPSLLPTLSHLRVVLNEELMAVLPITQEQMGKQVKQRIVLDARHTVDFNRLQLEFVGHYTDVCEDPAHSSLWLDISRKSSIEIKEQALSPKNDLSYFPEPFFDYRTREPLTLPFVFAGSPDTEKQKAAGIVASYFGMRAGWRGANFPVEFNTLPTRHAVVLATNDQRPDFLRDYPAVKAPVVDLMSHPKDPYVKLLVILGRNNSDLVQAATALVTSYQLFRGNSVTVEGVQAIAPRIPYDAPNWTRTDRPAQFSELLDFPEQLQVNGLRPRPIRLNLNLPPDLFVWQNSGVPLRLRYRYTPTSPSDQSRLNVDINSQFVASLPLKGVSQQEQASFVRLPLRSNGMFEATDDVMIPALQVGTRNTMGLDFSYASTPSSMQRDRCQTMLAQNTQAAIDGSSTLDLSGFHHYIAMPDLQAFASAGFPFSRMADLSETVVVVPPRAGPAQVGALLDILGGIAARTGYPTTGVRVTTNWTTASSTDADLIVLGPMPPELRDRPDNNMVIEATRSWLKRPRTDMGASIQDMFFSPAVAAPATRVDVESNAPIAALVGMQSPFHSQRSVVSLMATTRDDYALLRTAMADTGQRAAITGSVAIVRESGVSSQLVGPVYYTGSLPWITRLWFHLSGRYVLLAVASTLIMVIFASLVWFGMRRVTYRRTHKDKGH